MKWRLIFLSLCMAACATAQETTRIFTNKAGEPLEDRLIKYDHDQKNVMLEKSGRVPLDAFSQEDQDYIFHWAQVEGFKSTMRFKMALKKGNWARMKHEQTITPFYMDAIKIPGKKAPVHNIVMAEDYEEYTALYMEAQGFEIKMRNQNPFPLENLTVESKILYEQEVYVLTDSLFLSSDSEYRDTVTTNKVRFLSETVPAIIPHEEVVLYSDSAIIIDQQLDRTSISSAGSDDEDETEDDDDEEEDTEILPEDFGEWDDHSRRRKGKVIGVWFRVGVKNPEGEMVWREMSAPDSLIKKYSWDNPFPAEEQEEDNEEE